VRLEGSNESVDHWLAPSESRDEVPQSLWSVRSCQIVEQRRCSTYGLEVIALVSSVWDFERTIEHDGQRILDKRNQARVPSG
jgi:hypothetical protein